MAYQPPRSIQQRGKYPEKYHDVGLTHGSQSRGRYVEAGNGFADLEPLRTWPKPTLCCNAAICPESTDKRTCYAHTELRRA
jgi:hypothetical protein